MGVIILIVAVYLGMAVGGNRVRAKMAENNGNEFIKKLYAEYNTVSVSCQSQDHDGDGYVSCDFRLMSPDKLERVVHLQCPTISKTLIGESCKESRMILP